MIRGVFFDAGNTILFPDYYIYRDICEALGVEAAINEIVRAEAGARSAFDRSVADSPGSDVYGFWSTTRRSSSCSAFRTSRYRTPSR